MLLQSNQLEGASVVSLHTGQVIGQLDKPIIDPHKLEVAGFYCLQPRNKDESMVLLTQDIRDITPGKVLINSADEITSASHLIRLEETIKIGFSIVGKPVRTESKKRLGKVEDYVVDTDTFEVQKIYVKQSLLKNFTVHSLVIDREQIIDVTDRQITVADATMAKPAVVQPPTPAA
jgi:uncharacterized protein YrrD